MSNRKYSYIFSAVISSGNILSKLLTGLYDPIQYRTTQFYAPGAITAKLVQESLLPKLFVTGK